MAVTYLRKYGVQTTVDFPLLDATTAQYIVTAAHASGDTKIMKDEGTEANTTNAFTDEGQGYSIVLTATEMQAARIVVYVVDQGTKLWFDEALIIETYGHASAMHAIDFSVATQPVNVTQLLGTAWATPTTAGYPDVNVAKLLNTAWEAPATAGRPDVNVKAISTDTVAADNAEAYFDGSGYAEILRGGTTQAGGTLTTAVLDAGASATDEAYRDALFVITSGANIGKVRQIYSYVGSTKVATFFADDPLNAAPNTVSYVLLASSLARKAYGAAYPVTPLTGTEGKAANNSGEMIVVSGYPWIDLRKIAGDETAVTNLLAAMLTELVGAASGGGHTTTVMNTNLTETVTGKFIGRRVYWTSGVLNRESATITAYNGTTKQLGYAATTAAPSNGDTFVIV